MKIIFISSYSLSKFKYDQLNLSYFIELKQDFTWVDCSYLDNRKYYEDNKNNIFFIDNYVILKSISDLSNVINKNAKTIIIRVNRKIKFNLLYDSNRSLQKKIKLGQLRRETS